MRKVATILYQEYRQVNLCVLDMMSGREVVPLSCHVKVT